MKSKSFRIHNGIKTKSIILSVISIIELIILLTTMTLAWFEGITSLEIKGNNLHTASELKSKFIVGEGDAYSSTNENKGIAQLNEFFHKQSFDKLSPVSSLDGDNFYAITTGEAPAFQADYITAAEKGDITFRKLSYEEKLSSIVYFQFELEAASSDTDFWFKTRPTVKIGSNTLDAENNPFRFSIDDGSGKTVNNEGNYIFTTRTAQPTNNQYIRAITTIDDDGKATLSNQANIITNLADTCVFGTDANNDGEYKLFTVEKNTSKIITVAIWIEAFDPAYNENIIPPGATVEINLEFRSSWDVVDEVVFRDYTAEQWIKTADSNGDARSLVAKNTDTGNEYKNFEYDADAKEWKAEIPRGAQNLQFNWSTSTWSSNNARGIKKVFTAFGSTAGLWYDGEVDRITFNDHTGTSWVNDSSPKMKAKITYGGVSYEYSMAGPNEYVAGKDIWSAYIPSSVNAVYFNRYVNNALAHTWNGTGRIVEVQGANATIHKAYFALDGTVDDEPLDLSKTAPIYLIIPKAIVDNHTFLTTNDDEIPTVSLTSDANIGLFFGDNKLKDITKLPQTGAYNVGQDDDKYPEHSKQVPITSGVAPGTLLPVTTLSNGNLVYAFYFDKDVLASCVKSNGNVYLTFWSENHSTGYNNLDQNVHLAVVEFNYNNYPTYNTIVIKTMSRLTEFNVDSTNNNANLPYICTEYNSQQTFNTNMDPNLTTQSATNTVNGQWGAPSGSSMPAGTYQTFFIHTESSGVESVTAKFDYNGEEYTVDLTQSTTDIRKWYVPAENTIIPNDVVRITFTDSNNNTWTVDKATGTRTSSTNYFYATSNSTGKWLSQINLSGYQTYFVPPEGNTATSVTATFIYNEIPFSITLSSKDSNGHFFTTSIPSDATNIVFTDGTNSWGPKDGRDSTNCYYMATDGVWSKPASSTRTIYLVPELWSTDNAWYSVHAWNDAETIVKDIKMAAVTGQSGVYSAVLPEGVTQVLFCRMNSAASNFGWDNVWNKTNDLRLPSDSDTFTMTDWGSGTWNYVKPTTLYFKPSSSSWTEGNVRFAAYFFNDSTKQNTWISMTKLSDGYYSVDVPNITWAKVIFCSMDGSSNENKWENKKKQTGNLTIPTDGKNLFNGSTWSKK